MFWKSSPRKSSRRKGSSTPKPGALGIPTRTPASRSGSPHPTQSGPAANLYPGSQYPPAPLPTSTGYEAPLPGLPGPPTLPSYPPGSIKHIRLQKRPPRKRLPAFRLGCLVIALAIFCTALTAGVYLFAPLHENILVIGMDYADWGSAVARSDTIILSAFRPERPYVSLLSIPRDLWVTIPDVGENRINTAHFYAESRQQGTGPQALRQTIFLHFGVDTPYFIRIRFESFRDIVDALGGVDIEVKEPTAGYPVGVHHLTGRKALAFVRSRTNSDDFSRMSQGQMMLKALFKNILNPFNWVHLPKVTRVFFRSVDTDIPAWMWPRLAFQMLRAGPEGIQSFIITREMITPYTTPEGAMVLLPKWEAIRPLIQQIFQR